MCGHWLVVVELLLADELDDEELVDPLAPEAAFSDAVVTAECGADVAPAVLEAAPAIAAPPNPAPKAAAATAAARIGFFIRIGFLPFFPVANLAARGGLSAEVH